MNIPPPHDPREREVLTRIGTWEVRQFSAHDRRLAYFATRGFAHLQLWAEAPAVSILTPSRLTAGRFEVWHDGAIRVRASAWETVSRALEGVIAMPTAAELRSLERWFVTRHEPQALHLLRTWWRGASLTPGRAG